MMTGSDPLGAVLDELPRSREGSRVEALLEVVRRDRARALARLRPVILGEDRRAALRACWIVERMGEGHPSAVDLLLRAVNVRGMEEAGERALGEQGAEGADALLAIVASRDERAPDVPLGVLMLKFPKRHQEILEVVRARLREGVAHPYQALLVLGRLGYEGEDLYELCVQYGKHSSSTVRRYVLTLMARRCPNPDLTVRVAEAQANDSCGRVKMQAAYVLACHGYEVSKNIDEVAAFLTHEDELTALWALEYLGTLARKSPDLSPDVLRELRQRGVSGNQEVRAKWTSLVEKMSTQ